ncbi:MAG: glycosyltransferase family 4 protein [Planctomycetes bacterium]|nr:glycosyltransferase family 4 protein [Planctomycetota bacterium]
MRFLSLADMVPNPNSGAAGTVAMTAAALRARGHDVEEIWASHLGRRLRHGNLHQVFEAPRSMRRAVQEFMAKSHADVVLASQPLGHLAATWVDRHAPRSVFISKSHGWEPMVDVALGPHRYAWDAPRWTGVRAVPGWILHRLNMAHADRTTHESHGLIVSSTIDRDFIVREHSLPADRVAVIPLAPPENYRTTPPPPIAERAACSILNVGQAEFFKGVHTFVDLIERVVQARPDATFTWVARKEALHRQRLRLTEGASPRVKWVESASRAELLSVFDSHQIFVFPSLFEGFGKAFLEAMSRGLCVVASDAGGMRDVITHGHDGLLCPPGDADAFTAAILRLLAEPALREALSTAARETALNYSWARVGREVETFCEERLRVRRGERDVSLR